MSLILFSLALLGALLGGWLLWRRQAASPAPVRPVARTPRAAAGVQPGRAAAAAPAAPAKGLAAHTVLPALPTDQAPDLPPDALTSFLWAEPAALATAQRQALQDAIRHIPRPPSTLHQLLSPQFLERANSQALSELISAEARIAAKVLATVNAPLYGLQRPVASIGQAVTFLGLNTVRSICLRGLLDDSFPAADPALQQASRVIWNASALASELCNRLSSKLGMPDAGALVAQVLLSFLGHLASASLLAAQQAQPTGSLLARTRQAQDLLGLGPAEIGGLLLREWGLPASIADEVRAIDRLLVTPATQLAPADSQRQALAYLCARLGEHLATGRNASAGSLAGLAAGLMAADDSFHLRAHLAAPALARLPEYLQATDLTQALLAMQQGMQGPPGHG